MQTLQEKLIQREYDLACLNLWALVAREGIDPDDVKSFTFRPDFLTREQSRQLDMASYAARRDVSKHWHNCVRLKDDRIAQIPLVKIPKRASCDSSAYSAISQLLTTTREKRQSSGQD